MAQAKTSNLVIFTLFIVLISFGGILDQNAFAQEKTGDFLYEPAIKALTTFSTGVAESAPKIIAAVILLIIGLVAGKVVGKVIEKYSIKLLKKVNKNETDDDGLAQTTSSKDSSKLIAASVRWFVYLFFIIAAINALEFETLSLALTDLWLGSKSFSFHTSRNTGNDNCQLYWKMVRSRTNQTRIWRFQICYYRCKSNHICSHLCYCTYTTRGR